MTDCVDSPGFYKKEVLEAVMHVAGVSFMETDSEVGAVPAAKRKARAVGTPKPAAKRKARAVGRQSTLRKWVGRTARAQATILQLRGEIAELKQEIISLRVRSGRFILPREGMDMGLRAAMGNISANSIGMGLKTDLHAKTCVRWEIRLHASLVSFSKMAYKLCQDIDYSSTLPSLCVHVVSCSIEPKDWDDGMARILLSLGTCFGTSSTLRS